MGATIKPLNLRAESLGGDVPEWTESLFTQLNGFASDVAAALSTLRGVDIADNKSFTTTVEGAAQTDLKNPFPEQPGAVLAGKLTVFQSAAPYTAPYGFSWAMASGAIRCLFTGLAPSTKYRFTAAVIQ